MATTITQVPPYRQIRALYDDSTITVYQAYNDTIASAAVQTQRLSASPSFKYTRMTWIKPSWCWMMYRCGYTYKDSNQARVLALRIPHARFQEILASATISHQDQATAALDQARVQWDPERGPRQEKLEYRSIQIGIPPAVARIWAEEWISSIEDVTDRARSMKKALDDDEEVGLAELIERGLMSEERVYDLPMELALQLGMSL